MSVTVSDRPKGPAGRRRNLFIGLGVGLVILVFCCCTVLAVFAVLDPFGWVHRLLGAGAGAAAVMPPNSGYYIGLDLARLQSDEVDGLVATFAEAVGADTRDLSSLLEDLDQELEDEIGLTFSQDVQPWLGQYAGLSLLDLQLSRYGSFEEGKWLLAVEARDREAADAFIIRLIDVIADDAGGRFGETDYEGVTLYELRGSYQELAMARSEGYVLMGSTADELRAAIDAQRGESLADLDAYREATDPLPRQSLLTVFMSGEQILQLASAGSSFWGIDPSELQTGGFNSMAMALSVVEEGLRMEGVTVYDLESLGEAQRSALAIQPVRPTIDTRFPESTLFFMAGNHLDLSWQTLRASMAESPGFSDFEESLELLEEQIGINPDTELFPYLDGEFGIGLLPGATGLLPEQMGVPLSVLILAETSQDEALLGTIERLSSHMGELGDVPIQGTTIAGVPAFEVFDPYFESTLLVYGVGEGALFVGTGADVIVQAFGDGPSLAEDEQYRSTWDSFPSGEIPAFYLDLTGLLGQIREAESGPQRVEAYDAMAFLEPIRVIAATGSGLEGNRARSTFIVFIERSPQLR
jgi:hypothetical protein